jgi:tyrosyl-tRNA synthetase
MMWRYYELLTDVQIPEIEKMKREVHPMQAKKDLARRIVVDFHSLEAATKAGDDWAKQFQKDQVPENAEEVFIALTEIGGYISGTDRNAEATVRADRLLVRCGLASSTTDAGRKLKQGSVRIDDRVLMEPYFSQTGPPPMRLPLRVGKQLKIAVVTW